MKVITIPAPLANVRRVWRADQRRYADYHQRDQCVRKAHKEHIDLKIETVNAKIDATNTRIDALDQRIDDVEKIEYQN